MNKVQNGPCTCNKNHWVDHSEFGLPIFCNFLCTECGAIWYFTDKEIKEFWNNYEVFN